MLRDGGLLYTITDVAELATWMSTHCENHPSFERVPTEEGDPQLAQLVMNSSEESSKVARGGGDKFLHIFRRKEGNRGAKVSFA